MGPAGIPLPVVRVPALRLVKAPAGPIRAPGGPRGWKPLESYYLRVVAGILLVSIPISILLGFVVSNWSAQTSIDQTKARAEATAESAAVRITDWVAERQAELRTLASARAGIVGTAAVQTNLLAAMASHPEYESVQSFDTKANVVAASQKGISNSATPTGGTFANSLSVETQGPARIGGNGIAWIITAPILGLDERPQGVVAADLNPNSLERLLNPYGRDAVIGTDQETHVLNAEHTVVYSSSWGPLADDAAALAKGSLRISGESAIFEQAMTGGARATPTLDYRNHRVLAGYEPIPEFGWVVVASVDTSTALAPVQQQELRTSLLQGLSTLLLIAFAIVLAIYTTRPIVALSRAAASVEAGDLSARVKLGGGAEGRRLGDTVNAMIERLSGVLLRIRGGVTESAPQLSEVAQQLAAATLEQTTAATATSASMEEVARTSATIADTVDRVAVQAGEAQANP